MAENLVSDDGDEYGNYIGPNGLPALYYKQKNEVEQETFTKAITAGRPANPLSEFASYTYNLTLYMVTPEAYSIFLAQGQQIASNGFFVVASSGGNDSFGTPKVSEDREFFIDDVSFKTIINPKASASATMSHSFDIKIIEPYGFSFTTVLKNKIQEISQSTNITKGNNNALQAFYVLAIKFVGYGDDGNYKNQDVIAQERGLFGDQPAFSTGITVSYFPITFAEFSFKLDGKGTTYMIKGVPTSNQEAYGITTSQIQNPSELSGKTIGDILGDEEGNTGLMGLLNKKEKELKGQYANEFKIVVNDYIKRQPIIAPERYDKLKTKGAYATTSRDSSALNSVNNYGYDPASRNFSVTKGMPLVKFIDNVILTSEYVTNSLNTIYTEDSETESIANSDEQGLSWYMINPVVVPREYDALNKKNCYTITYYIDRYKIPYVRSAFVTTSKKTPYYGAYKIYNYFFTGKNTEVVSFDLTYNNLYFIPGKSNTNSTTQTPSADSVPVSPDMKTQGMDTAEAKAGNPVGSIKTNLYSPGDQATARLQILGDPDWLMTTLGTTPNATSPREAAYGRGYSINPVTGQCFIEINFYEGVDYDTSTGTMKINKNLQFYSTPNTGDITGLVFLVTEVTSTFSRGKFIQDLTLVLWPEAELRKSGAIPNEGRETTNIGTNTPNQGFGVSSSSGTTNNQPQTPNEGEIFVNQTNQSIRNAITSAPTNLVTNNTVAGTLNEGQIFNAQTNQSIVNAITNNTTVVDDDSYAVNLINNQPAASYAGINFGGREV
jgi:hypothetical protein